MSIIKQVILTVISATIIFLFFTIPVYRNWLNTVIEDEKKISVALNQLDYEIRKNAWWGDSYIISKNISDYFPKHKFDPKEALILFPPHQYLINKNMDFQIPEPAKFYYFTGLKSVWADNPLAEKANYVVAVENNTLLIIPVKKDTILKTYLTEFRKYKITL